MKKGDYLSVLLRSDKTIFSIQDIAILWREVSGANLRARLHYAVKHGKLIHVRRGLYAKNSDYNPYELAVKINTPSYISFETVLAKAGVIFQYYESIFVASHLTKTVSCAQHEFNFKKIKMAILTNPAGILHQNEYAIATPERALLDTLYLNKAYYVDNLSVLNWDKIFALLLIYNNKRLQKEIESLFKLAKL